MTANRRVLVAAAAALLSGSVPAVFSLASSAARGTGCPANLAPPPSVATPGSTPARVIVTGPGAGFDVSCSGGWVDGQLQSIGATVADVPPSQIAPLTSVAGLTVTPDLPVQMAGFTPSTGPHTPSDAFLSETGATTVASAGNTGSGITVAVLDTGVDALPDFAGRLVGGVDLTGENNPWGDDYGHGTFVAGLIAGNGASSNGTYSGEAPGANLVSVKVAPASGTTDMATVISGIQWVIANRQQYGIRVLNLSLGVMPPGPTSSDPLDQAVEAAWNAGIVVVAAAGNLGPFNGTIVSPGDDPLVLTVGALDDMGTPSPADDLLNDFSSVGPTWPDGWMKPDLVTSGRSVVSVAAPGSTVYNQYPSAQVGPANFVGSGTSFSAAITSGAAALVLAANPYLSPNQVKSILVSTTSRGPVGLSWVDGHGALNVAAAVKMAQAMTGASGRTSYTGSSWLSGLSSGSTSFWWSGAAWNGAAWDGAAWNGSAWNGAAWNGSAWNGAAWNGAAWNGAAWNGSAWNGAAWNGAAWDGAAWDGAAWN